MAKDLKYIVEDNEVIELFGRQSFSTKESAILELVKNAFDAKSPNLYIEINYNENDKSIFIKDYGEGMNSHDIETKWVHVGVSNKGYDFKDAMGNERIYSGQKGVGRFALARLGGVIELKSKQRGNDGIVWRTDWNYNNYDFDLNNNHIGTSIKITNLRDKWSPRDFRFLVEYLERTCKNNNFKIELKYNQEESIIIKNVFSNSTVGINYSGKIEIGYLAEQRKINVKVYSDEFTDEVKKILNTETKFHEKTIDLNDLEEIDFDEDTDASIVLEELKLLGDFTCDFFFSLDTTSDDDVAKFNYKYKTITERYKTGIILYRNSFSISSYDGKKDWLELNRRVRNSPAAASHKSGAWRVRSNQISGMVNIDKKKNEFLKDLGNRQGLEENDFYNLFTQIIILGIEEFEWYRQGIVRKIAVINDEKPNSIEKSFIDEVLENPKILLNMTPDSVKSIVGKIKTEKKEAKRIEKKRSREIEDLYYDIRMLNSLSTIGLKSSSIAHELGNDKNFLYEFNDNVIGTLKENNLWEELRKNKEFNKNVPKLLEKNEKISKKLIRFLETNLELIELDTFDKKKMSFYEILKNIKERWETDYKFISIEIIEIGMLTNIDFYEDVVNVIFDNLILNSIQQNNRVPSLNICIAYEIKDDFIRLTYSDNGKGLAAKYRDNPQRILQPHESTRRKSGGHGLGMWIVNNTINYTKGSIVSISNPPGFTFIFEMGRFEE